MGARGSPGSSGSFGSAGRSAAGAVDSALSGSRLILDGLSMLRRERSLWGLAAVPLLLSLVAVAGAISGIVVEAAAIHGFVTDWLPVLEAGAWYTWLWIGPAQLALALLGYVLFIVFSAVCIAAACLIANLLASPFMDALSARVERILTGSIVQSSEGLAALLRDAPRSLANEVRRLGFFLGVWALIFGFGVVVPGGQLVAPPALAVLTALFLPLEYSGFTLDRRQVSFRQRRAWVRGNLWTMVGFGGAAFVICLVPGLNLLLIPGLVVAGTLLALRHPPAAVADRSR